MQADNTAKSEAAYWENVVSDLSTQGMDFRNRDKFVAKDPKHYWEDANITKIVIGYPKEALKKQITPGLRILDLGSGSGSISYMMAKEGADVLGVDIQEKTVNYLNEEMKKEPHLKLKFDVMDLNNAVFPENHFDIIVSWNTLHHIKNTDRLIREVNKALKENGHFVLLEHNHTHSFLRKILAAFFWMILPTKEKFKEKLSIIRGRAKGQSEEELSPAEDSAVEDYLDRVKKTFHLKEEKNFLGFTSPFVARIRGREKIRLFLVKLVNFIDRILIKTHLLQGEQKFLIMKKK